MLDVEFEMFLREAESGAIAGKGGDHPARSERGVSGVEVDPEIVEAWLRRQLPESRVFLVDRYVDRRSRSAGV